MEWGGGAYPPPQLPSIPNAHIEPYSSSKETSPHPHRLNGHYVPTHANIPTRIGMILHILGYYANIPYTYRTFKVIKSMSKTRFSHYLLPSLLRIST